MSLGLDTPVTMADIIAGFAIVISLGLCVELGRTMEGKTGQRRGLVWMAASLILGVAWWLTFDHSYFPQTEVVTAVIPAFHHPYAITWQAPYGLLWYILNIPAWRLGSVLFPFVPSGVDWMFSLLILNLPFIYLFRKSELLIAYFMTSLFLWFVVPWNLSVLWLVTLGFLSQHSLVRLGSVALGVAAKMPLGAPLSVWRYDFLNGQEGGTLGSAFVPGHLMPYAVLGAWCFAVLLKPYIHYLSLDSHYFGQVNSRAAEGSGPVAGDAKGSDGKGTFERAASRTRCEDD